MSGGHHSGTDSGSDSAGVPWAGRTLSAQPFAGDTGEPDAALVDALARHAAGSGREVEVVAAWAPTRVFVPVVAVVGEGAAVTATKGDTGADMALVTLTGRDGTRALPVFTSTRSLAAWDSQARPVPVEAARAALSGVAESCDVLVLDPAGPTSFVISRSAVWAVAQGREWVAAADDPLVQEAVRQACPIGDGVCGLETDVGEGGDGVLDVRVHLVPDLTEIAFETLVGVLRTRLGASEVIAERADALHLVVIPAAPAERAPHSGE